MGQGRGNSSSLLAVGMLCLWLEATAGHGMNEDHSMPEGIETWKLCCDTEFINTNTNTLRSNLGSQYLCLPVHLGGHTLTWEPNKLHTFSPLATCCLKPRLSLCSCHQPPWHWQWACSHILDCNYKTAKSSTKLQQQMEKVHTWNMWSIHTSVRLKTYPA